MSRKPTRELSHVDNTGSLRMVAVGGKPVTERVAVARGAVHMSAATVRTIRKHAGPKGDPLEAARLAGILGAKRTAELIPLCHSLPLDHVDVQLQVKRDRVEIESQVVCHGRTGVEMEALAAVSVAALTIYDMCKAVDREMVIGDICLVEKKGGRSGHYRRGRS